MIRVTVPGNLLLLGEYAVLEPQGLGLALAVEPRVRISAQPDRRLSILSHWGGTTTSWALEKEPGDPGTEFAAPGTPPALFAAVIAVCREQRDARVAGRSRVAQRPGLGANPRGPSFQARIRIDSRAFFQADGSKRGFGSSAAVCVGLCAVLLRLNGLTGEELDSAIFQSALEAHRRLQGGKGSGYDVAASLSGGVGLFSGGPRPTWQGLELCWLPALGVFPGHRAVTTASSIDRYQAWKGGNPYRARRFTRRSNRRLRRFLAAKSWPEARPFFQSCRDLGLRLGEQIGVPAEITPPWQRPTEGVAPGHPPGVGEEWLRESAYKALGAGNELGVLLGYPEEPVIPRLEAATIAREGLRWEE